MISVAPTITDAGKDLLFRAVSGEAITFTRFKIGNGNLENSEIAPLTDLINPLVEFPIVESDASEKGYVKITGKFDNTYIKDEFQWRELGLFCKGEDGIEVLYAYSNDGENAGVLKVQTSDVVAEQTVALVIAIGDAPNVTAILSDLVLYTPKTEFDEHINAKNPHGLDAEAVGLGEVPNVSTNDQTPTYTVPTEVSELKSGEKLGIAFGKIAKAVSSLIAHLKNTNNPHGLSAKSLGAAESKHEHSAADINTGVLSILRGGTGATTAEQARANLGAVAIETGSFSVIGVVNKITFETFPRCVIFHSDGGSCSAIAVWSETNLLYMHGVNADSPFENYINYDRNAKYLSFNDSNLGDVGRSCHYIAFY